MRHAPLILVVMLVAACDAPQVMAVDSNVRNPGEPSTTNRQLSRDEQREVVKAIADSEPAGQDRKPLAPAGESGRWREVGVVAREAAKSCEMAVVSEQKTADGKVFTVRSIKDERGTLVVTGDEAHGVTDVQVQVGSFNENRSAATALQDAFWRKLREYARVHRAQ
jgi:hypothetical protein